MTGTAVAQIVLRNLFDSGIVWGDVLVRILVLWIGLFGAMIASRTGNHVHIDLITRWIPEHFRYIVNGLTELVTAVICGVTAYYSIRFVHTEILYGGSAFAGIPVWICESVIPLAFIVMGLRYLFLSLAHIRQGISMLSAGFRQAG